MFCTVSIGLMHRSQISNTAVDSPDEVLSVGEKIFCKVISAEVHRCTARWEID